MCPTLRSREQQSKVHNRLSHPRLLRGCDNTSSCSRPCSSSCTTHIPHVPHQHQPEHAHRNINTLDTQKLSLQHAASAGQHTPAAAASQPVLRGKSRSKTNPTTTATTCCHPSETGQSLSSLMPCRGPLIAGSALKWQSQATARWHTIRCIRRWQPLRLPRLCLRGNGASTRCMSSSFRAPELVAAIRRCACRARACSPPAPRCTSCAAGCCTGSHYQPLAPTTSRCACRSGAYSAARLNALHVQAVMAPALAAARSHYQPMRLPGSRIFDTGASMRFM
jgi:hypothetical protein